MHSSSNQAFLTWQALAWRLILTAILLFVLAGSGLTIFSSIIGRPDAQVLPTVTLETGAANPTSGIGLER